MIRTLAVLVLLFLLTPFAAARQGQQEATRELTQLINEIHAAVRSKDEQALQRLVAEDFVNIHRHGGTQQNRGEWLAMVRAGDIAPASHGIENVRVRVFGDAAVVHYTLKSKGKFRGREIDDTGRVTRVFVKRGGRWQCVSAQYTVVAQP